MSQGGGAARARVEAALDAAEADVAGINAFITVDREGALEAADVADARAAAGRSLGPLDGVPVAVKDSLDTAGLRTTFGSGMYAHRVPERDAEAVMRLRAAGAAIVGKTNMTELACGTFGKNEWFGDCHNPHDTSRYPGGSSSGSAAAVAAGIVDHAVGSDTSCSIRQPAAVCGVVGLKPTYGRVSAKGNSICSPHLDHVGPIGATVDAAADLLSALQEPGWGNVGANPLDAGELPTLRIGVLGGPFVDACAADVGRVTASAIDLVGELGHRLVDVDLGLDLVEVDELANVLCADMIEAYGQDVADAPPDRVGASLRNWFDIFGESIDRYDEALAMQRHVTAHIESVMAERELDVLLCAATRVGAGLLADADEDRQLRMGNLAIWDMTGQPSLTVPCGAAETGMPLGLLFNGRRGDDALVLRLGRQFERARS